MYLSISGSFCPAIMILPVGGWKHKNHSFCGDESAETLKELEDCFKKYTYTVDQTILWHNMPIDHTFTIEQRSGFASIVKPHPGTISPNGKSLTLSLNPDRGYFVAFTDPKYQIISTNPSIVPYEFQTFSSHAGLQLLYLEVS